MKKYAVWFATDVGFLDVEAKTAKQAQEKAEKIMAKYPKQDPPGFVSDYNGEIWAYPPSMIRNDNDLMTEVNLDQIKTLIKEQEQGLLSEEATLNFIQGLFL